MNVDTTPRERAIPIIAAEMEECFPSMRGEGRMLAKAALNALANHPEVLRALAGAPDVTATLAAWERDYVRALNAILAAYDDNSADAHRWRGHAEAYRQVCERLRRDLGMEPAAYTSTEWRQAHGVYSDEQVAEFRRFTKHAVVEPEEGTR